MTPFCPRARWSNEDQRRNTLDVRVRASPCACWQPPLLFRCPGAQRRCPNRIDVELRYDQREFRLRVRTMERASTRLRRIRAAGLDRRFLAIRKFDPDQW
jgi:hypothetical protein